MERKRILFTSPGVAEYVTADCPELKPNQVLVKNVVSTISSGTERANLLGDPNCNSTRAPGVKWPRAVGYSSAGIIVEVGEKVKDLQVGDRVALFGGTHSSLQAISQNDVMKLPDDVPFEEAAIWQIATFPLAAVRKCRLEIGESAIVMGQGILGQMAIIELRLAGAVPIIAVDPVKEKREQALALGADYALDPFDPNFAATVKELTDGGAKVAIEVTGIGAGLDGVLDCMRPAGRVALLGCTRNSNFTIDYYRKVHFPGISLIGAHTGARPNHESSAGLFTHRDDIQAVLRLCAMGRIDIKRMTGVFYSPADCQEAFNGLIYDKNFPIVVQFDWTRLPETTE